MWPKLLARVGRERKVVSVPQAQERSDLLKHKALGAFHYLQVTCNVPGNSGIRGIGRPPVLSALDRVTKLRRHCCPPQSGWTWHVNSPLISFLMVIYLMGWGILCGRIASQSLALCFISGLSLILCFSPEMSVCCYLSHRTIMMS